MDHWRSIIETALIRFFQEKPTYVHKTLADPFFVPIFTHIIVTAAERGCPAHTNSCSSVSASCPGRHTGRCGVSTQTSQQLVLGLHRQPGYHLAGCFHVKLDVSVSEFVHSKRHETSRVVYMVIAIHKAGTTTRSAPLLRIETQPSNPASATRPTAIRGAWTAMTNPLRQAR
jgi:hypothetical protein